MYLPGVVRLLTAHAGNETIGNLWIKLLLHLETNNFHKNRENASSMIDVVQKCHTRRKIQLLSRDQQKSKHYFVPICILEK